MGAAPMLEIAASAWRDLRWRHVRTALLLGLVVSCIELGVYWVPIITLEARTTPLAVLLCQLVVSYEIKALFLMLAVVVADRAVDEGLPRLPAYLLATLIGCLVGVLVSESVLAAWRALAPPGPPPRLRKWLQGTAVLWFRPIFFLTDALVVGGTVVFLYADRRAARCTEALLRAAEIDRARRSKLALESRLQSMQARVEPGFLLRTLGHVERLYEQDPHRAARMLDDLIDYLRAAMPRMRDTASTLAQEMSLARAWLDIARLRLARPIDVAIEQPPGSDEIRMPPMLLLPIVERVVARAEEHATQGAAIEIRATVDGSRVCVTIDGRRAGGGALEAPDLEDLRKRLDALYGEPARLALRSGVDGGMQALVELPLEARGKPEDLRSALPGIQVFAVRPT